MAERTSTTARDPVRDPAAPLLVVDDLRVRFTSERGAVHAVNGVSFEVAPGDTLGIVGESGCGKSVTSLALLGLLPRAGEVTGGTAMFEGRDLLQLRERDLRQIRGREISMIFQDPMTSLNPVLTVGRQVREALEAHEDIDRRAADRRVLELLDSVGIPSPDQRVRDYPHQFSGGMRQRAMIAMALACKPRLLIADEPTTALDVTIQAQILALLRALVRDTGTALLLITHDLGVVAGMCERVHVMYGGMVMEAAPTDALFREPRHPYTLGLLESVPRVDALSHEPLKPIPGAPGAMRGEPCECPFRNRCTWEVEQSAQAVPPLIEVAPGHKVACFNPVPADEWARERARRVGT